MTEEVPINGPPEEIIAQIVAIAAEEGVRERADDLVATFLEHHEIGPEEPAIVAALRSGYRVYAEGDDWEILDALVLGIVGETITGARTETDWAAHFRQLERSLLAELQHVVDTMHRETVRALFAQLLWVNVLARYRGIVEQAFPHLSVDPQRVGTLVRDMRSGAVLLLGQDSTSEGMERLGRIRGVVDSSARTSMLIKEQDDLDAQGLTAKLLLNSVLARYVVVENTFPSGHLYELPHLHNAGVIVALLQERGRGASHMPNDLLDNSAVMKRFFYDIESLEITVVEAMEWAEAKLDEVAAVNRSTRPWLVDDSSDA